MRISHQQSKPSYTLYMEYRDNTGASQYYRIQFPSLNEALTWMNTQAYSIHLEAICPASTSKRPVRDSQITQQNHEKKTESSEAA